jgi:hypothetical protein
VSVTPLKVLVAISLDLNRSFRGPKLFNAIGGKIELPTESISTHGRTRMACAISTMLAYLSWTFMEQPACNSSAS